MKPQSRRSHVVIPEDEYTSQDENINVVSNLLSGRIIAFQREFVDIAGSAAGALFLSQSMYWMKKAKDGWFYKSRDEWTEETGLTRYEQESARKILKASGILEEIRKGCPFKLYFRINKAKIYKTLLSIHSVENNPMDGGIQPDDGLKTTDYSAGNNQPYKEAEITTETTQEITHKTDSPLLEQFTLIPPDQSGKNKKPIPAEIPEWLPAEEWAGYVEMRSKIRHPLTDYAKKLELRKLDKLRSQGNDPAEVLQRSITKCYRGLFEINDNGGQNGRLSKDEERNARNARNIIEGLGLKSDGHREDVVHDGAIVPYRHNR